MANPSSRRNKGFEATHRQIIDAAVTLISDKGVAALSMAAVARAAGINRTTLYYHFADRDAMLRAVRDWSAAKLADGFSPQVPQAERIDHIARFVLANPALIGLWIEDFLSPGDIRERYPKWDALVEGIDASMAARGQPVDAEVYCAILLTSAFIAPHVFAHSIRPDLDRDAIVARFRAEQQRTLAHDALLKA